MNNYAIPEELIAEPGASEFPTPRYKLGFAFFRRPYFSDPFFCGILFAVGLLLLSKAIYVHGQGQIDLSSQSIVTGVERGLIAFHLAFILLWMICLPFLITRARKDKRIISDHETLISDINGVIPKWKAQTKPFIQRRLIELLVLTPFIIAAFLIGTGALQSQQITKDLNASFLRTYNLNLLWNKQIKPLSDLVPHLSKTVNAKQYPTEVAQAQKILDLTMPALTETESRIQYECDHVQRTTKGSNNEAKYRAVVVKSMLDTCHSLPIQSREISQMVKLQLSKASNAEIQKHQANYDAEYFRRLAVQKEVLLLSAELTKVRGVRSTISIWTVLSPI